MDDFQNFYEVENKPTLDYYIDELNNLDNLNEKKSTQQDSTINENKCSKENEEKNDKVHSSRASTTPEEITKLLSKENSQRPCGLVAEENWDKFSEEDIQAVQNIDMNRPKRSEESFSKVSTIQSNNSHTYKGNKYIGDNS